MDDHTKELLAEFEDEDFTRAWAQKYEEGYRYGRDALQGVHFGYDMRRGESWPPALPPSDKPIPTRITASTLDHSAIRLPPYHYDIKWSPEDGEYVARCEEFPSLSWLDADPLVALSGLLRSIHVTLIDMSSEGETPPSPLGPMRTSSS